MPAERQTVREYWAGVWIWNMGHKKILPVCIVWIELAPEVIPVIVSLGAMFDASILPRAGKPYGKRLA
jgi:hypothetical protein